MKVITGTRQFQIEEPTVVTIGKFDGRHRGHQKLLQEMNRMKKEEKLAAAVFTFDTAPMKTVTGKPVTVITTCEERRSKLLRTSWRKRCRKKHDDRMYLRNKKS